MVEKKIDCRGLKCPEPIKKAQEEIDLIKEGVLTILVESPSNWNIERLAKKAGMKVESTKHEGYYELKILKTPESKPQKEGFIKRLFGKKEEKKTIFVITKDAIGSDEALGKILIKGLFETLKIMNNPPDFMFFMNTGVRLTTSDDEELIETLGWLLSNGSTIYTCSTCLKYYGIEEKLKVGEQGGMAVLIEAMGSAGRIFTI